MRRLIWIAFAVGLAAQDKPAEQTPAPAAAAAAAAPDAAGGTEWLTGSVDVGYRWVTGIAGSVPTYRSVVNLGEGPRLLGADFTIENPSKKFFDRLTVSGIGWGGDPYTTAHVDVVKRGIYRFTFDYRSIAYFDALPSFANPFVGNGVFLDQQAFDTHKHMANYDLELRPGSRIIPYLTYARDSDQGTGVTDFVVSANEYPVANLIREHTDNYRGGIRFEFAKFHLTLEEGATVFKDDEQVRDTSFENGNLGGVPYIGQPLYLSSLLEAYGIRGTNPYSRVLMTASPLKWLDLFGQFSYSMGTTNVNFNQGNTGEFVQLSSLLFYTTEVDLLTGEAKQPHTSATLGFEMRPFRKLRLVENWNTDRLHTASSASLADTLGTITGTTPSTFRLVDNYNQQSFDIFYDLTSKITLRGGERYVYGDTTVPSFYETPLPGNLESGQLSRQAGVAGINVHLNKKLSGNFDFEGGAAAQAYYRTSLQDYRKYRARVRYQPLTSLSITGTANILTNDNPLPSVQYTFSSKEAGASIQWDLGKRLSLIGEYAYTTVHSDILYLVPETLTAAQSFYREIANQASGLLDYKLAMGSRVMHISAGGSLFIGWGSLPTRLYQPMAKITVPVVKHVEWITQWNWYGFNEPVYAFEAFRDTQFTTSLRLSR
jgi:hypothetical protein